MAELALLPLTPGFTVPSVHQPQFPHLGLNAGPLKDQRLQIGPRNLETILNLR